MANTWEVTPSGGGSSLVYKDERDRPIFTISGLSSTGAVSSYFTVDDDNRSIKVSASALAGLGNGSSISVSDNYTFVLDSGIANKAEIIGTTLSFAGNGSTQTVTGSLSSYYELTNQQSSITFHDIQTNQTLATIGGLSTNASLSFVESSGSLSTIRLDKGEDLTSTAVSLSLSSIAGVDVAGYGLKFALYDSTSAAGTSSKTSVGFGSLSATWATTEGGFVYKSNNDEGWMLSDDGMGVSHAGKSSKEILKITGFKGGTSVPSAGSNIVIGNPYVSVGSAYQKAITTTDGTTFTVYEKALPTTGSGLQLTTLEGASAGTNYGFSFAADEQASLGGSGTTLGMSNGENYWYRKGTTLNYQYDTSQGWSISGLNVTYTGAKTSLDSTADPTTLVSISGLSSVTTAAVVTSGLSVSDSTITILNTSFFDTSADGKTATFTDEPEGLSYTLALSSAIAQSAAVNYTTANDTAITVTGTSAVIKGKLDAYYSLSGNVVTYHASQANQPLATIMGLATGAQFNEFKGGDSVITLDLDDLGTENVFLTTEGYSGIKAYSLALSATGSASVGTLSQVVDSAVSATVSLSGTTFDVNGKTEKYYTLSGTSVTYHPPEDAFLATIIGLSTTATVDVATDGRTLKLSQDDLTASNVILNQKYVGNVKEHGLSLALVNDSGSGVSKIGGDDSGNYWTVSNGSASYQHYTTEAWEYTNSSRISYTAAKNPDVWFSISGLSNINGFSVSGTSVIIDTDYLDKSATIQINKVKGKDYTFNLKAIDSDDTATEVGFDNKDGNNRYWKVKQIGDTGFYTATYQYDVNEGWELKTDGSIKYTAAVTKDLAVITGIKLSGTFEIGKEYTDEGLGITATLDNSKDYTFKLSSAILGASNITLAKGGSAAATDTFSLEIAGAYALNGQSVYGFDNYDHSKKYWYTSGDSIATYQFDVGEGWELSGNSIIYHRKNEEFGGISKVDVTLTGINSSYSAISGAISGITVLGVGDKKTILISDEALFGLDYSASKAINFSLSSDLKTGAYSLSLASSLATVAKYGSTSSVVEVESGTATVKGTLKGYFTISEDKQTVTRQAAQENESLAVISGLSSDADGDAVSINGTIITLGVSALGYSNITVTNQNGIDDLPVYKFDLESGVSNKKDVLDEAAGFSLAIDGNTATIKGRTKVYYTLLDSKAGVSYHAAEEVTLGTITGLSAGASLGENVTIALDGNGGISIGLSNAALGAGNIALNDLTSVVSGANKLYFTLAEDIDETTNGGTSARDGKVGFVAGSESFARIGTEAVVHRDVGAGWTLDRTGKKITYTAEKTGNKGTVLAKVTGLNSKYNTEDLVSFDEVGGVSTITLSASALGERNVVLTTTATATAEGLSYALALNNFDGTSVTAGNSIGLSGGNSRWSIVDGVAYLKQDQNAGWTFTSDQFITYSPMTTGAIELASVTGLKSTLKGGLKVDADGQIAGVSVAGTSIILSSSVLGTDEITLTDMNDEDGLNYELALGGDVVQDGGGVAYWTSKGTTGTYKKDTQAYYSLSGTSSVVYTAGGTKTLATLTNLPKGLVAASTGADRPATIDGITVLPNDDDDMLKILVGAKALGTDAKKPLTLSGTSTADQLAFDTDVVTKQGNHVWTYGTTTTLKEASIAGGKSYLYELAGGSTKINYNTPTISKNAIVTLGGLVNTVSATDIVYYDDLDSDSEDSTDPKNKAYWNAIAAGGSLAGASTAADLSHAVILKDTALDNKNVTLTNLTAAGSTKYNLFLYDTNSTDTISMSAPVIGASSTGWTLNKTNAIYTGDLSQGYTLGAYNEKKGTWTYTYSAAKEGATLFTIGGLPNDITQTELNKIDVTLNDDTGIYEVTVPASILVRTTGKLTLKGTGYVFKLPTDNSSVKNFLTAEDAIVSGKDANGDGDFEDDGDTKPGVDVWRYSGNTATYKRVIPTHYALTNDNTTISYVKEADVQITHPTNDRKKISKVYATISGLPKGLTVVNNYSGSSPASKITDGTIENYITVADDDDKTYTLDNAAVAKVSSITFTPGTGDVGTNTFNKSVFGDFDETTKTTQSTLSDGVWTINGTTATLKMGGKKAGWASSQSKDKKSDIYTKKALEATGTTALQITGLKKGLTVNEDGQIDGITVANLTEDSETKAITGSVSIASSVYGASPVVFKRGKTATNLSCSAEDVPAEANQEIWSLNGTTLTIQKGTTASYTYDESKGTVTYKKPSISSTLVKITGLKNGLTLNSDGKIDGINVTGTTITLDSRALGTTSVTADNNYKIELKADDNNIQKVTYEPTWSFSGEKATLKAASSGGFDTTATTKNGTTTLKYNAASAGNVLLTIDGLQKGLNVTTDVDSSNKSNNFVNAIDGIDTSELTFSTDKSKIESGTVKVNEDILNKKTVTLTNGTGNSATLELDTTNLVNEPVSEATKSKTIWEVDGTTGKLYNAYTEGYAIRASSDNTILDYYNGKTKYGKELATVKGLKKSLKPGSDGQIEGIAVDTTSHTITLDSRALGTTNVSVSVPKDATTYTLELDTTGDYKVVDTSNPAKTYKCTVKGTTVTIREFTPASYELNSSTGVIEYTGAKQGNVVATLSGVVSGLKADAEGNITGIKVTQGGDSGEPIEVKLGKEVFGTTAVTLNPLTDSRVQLAVKKPSTETYSWRVDNDNLILTTNYSEGYKLSDNKATYTTGGLVNTVITGLTDLTDGASGTDKDLSISSISVDWENKTITVTASDSNCAGTVTIAGGDYTLKLDDNEPGTGWEFNGTTAIFYKKLKAEDSYTCDGVKISQVTADRTEILATITGLPEGMTKDDFDTTTKDADGNTIITFKTSAKTKLLDNTTNIKLTGNGYKLAFADEEIIKPHATGGEEWSLKGTTATLAKGTTAGYTLSADGKTATYSAFAMAKGTKASATITNLNSTVKLSEIQTAANATDKTIKLTESMLGTKDLTITGSYKFAKDPNSSRKWSQDDAEETTGWTADKKGNATYQNMTGAYYTFSESKVTYNAAKAGSEIAKVTGLNKNIKAVDGKIDGIDVGGDYITLSNSVLAGGNVSVSGGNYKLSLKYDVPEPESTDPELSLNKTTAYLKNSTSAGYTVNDDEKGITYHKASNNTIATLTGLKKGLKYADGAIDGISFDGDKKTITVSDLALGTTNVSLTNNLDEGYELALDRDSVLDDEDSEVKNGNDTWSTNKTTVTFKNVTPAHYELDEENNVIKYVRDTDATTYASITGVKNFDEATNFSGGTSGGTITLYGNNIAGNVGVTSAEGTSFKLALGDDSLESKVNADTLAWSYSTSKDNVRTAKLSGKVTAGYVLEENDTKISAQKVAGKDFAVISGVNVDDLNTFIVGADDKSVTLDSSQLEEAVTVSTSFGFEVQFTGVDTTDEHTIKTITGSTGADNIAVWCSGVEVSLGGGDDHVYIATTGNTIVYGAGEGNDVIDGFTTSDKLKITKGSVDTAVENADGDVVLTVKDGSTTSTITLKNTNISATSNNYVTYEAEGKESTFKVKAASADLLYDEESNFVTAGSQLDEITPVTPAAQSLDEDFTSPQNFKLLTKQNSLLAYFNSKKK